MTMKEIEIKDLNENAMTMIGREWMLITAGNKERGYNTMTASWGHLGSLWGKMTAVVYIRPSRYTKEFVDREEYFSLSVLPEKYREELVYLGRHSGRDEDKVAVTGITPVFDEDTAWFEEARLVLKCRKLYRAPVIEEGFIDKNVLENCYPEREFHDIYVAEIVKVMVKE